MASNRGVLVGAHDENSFLFGVNVFTEEPVLLLVQQFFLQKGRELMDNHEVEQNMRTLRVWVDVGDEMRVFKITHFLFTSIRSHLR